MALEAQTTSALDLSDLLRAELVLAVSALDHYIHELVRLGMLEAYNGNRPQSQACLRFQVTLSGAQLGISNPTNDEWLEDQIRTSHSYQSFQDPDHIADAIRLISDVQLWNEVAYALKLPYQDIRTTHKLIVNRRNQIAHEADMSISYPGSRWPIDAKMVDEAVDFLERLAETIFWVVS